MNQIELIKNETLDILFYGLCFFTALYLLRFFFQTYRLAFYKLPTTIGNSKNYPPVSIVVCARDEADNLTNFLPELLAQDYPDFEVIIVNDCSNDHTDDVLREFARLFDNLKVITVKVDDQATFVHDPLLKAMPQPATSFAEIHISLPTISTINLELCSMQGNSVITIQNGSFEAGDHGFVLNLQDAALSNISSGMYMLRLKTQTSTVSMPFHIVR